MRRRRLRRALADFDAATIATTHGFCQEVLGGLGIAADLEPGHRVRRGPQRPRRRGRRRPVRAAVSQRRLAAARRAPRRGEIARIAIANPAARDRARPTGDGPGDARAARRGGPRRARGAQAADGGDDLRRPAHPARRRARRRRAATPPSACARRYEVVLVDEFQDTDPVQWDIMRRAFGETGAHAGADRATPSRRSTRSAAPTSTRTSRRRSEAAGAATLDVNWRSDQGLIDAYDALFGGAKLGHEGIVYRRVRAADGPPRLAPARRARATRRCGSGSSPRRTRSSRPHNGLRAGRIRRASTSPPTSPRTSSSCCPRGPSSRTARQPATRQLRELRPATSRCWCRPTATAALIREALERRRRAGRDQRRRQRVRHRDRARVAAAARGARAPGVDDRAHSAALTVLPRLVGRAGRRGRRGRLGARAPRGCTTGRGCCATRGVAVADRDDHARRAAAASGCSPTSTASAGSPICATSASCCTPRRRASSSATTALTAWLRRRIAEADDDTGDEERSRRLESDARPSRC